jgi:hypothetical protein
MSGLKDKAKTFEYWFMQLYLAKVGITTKLVLFEDAQKELDEHGKNNEALAKVCLKLKDETEAWKRWLDDTKQQIFEFILVLKAHIGEENIAQSSDWNLGYHSCLGESIAFLEKYLAVLEGGKQK